MTNEDEAIGTDDLNRPQQMGAEPDYNDKAYDDLLDDAKKDDAIGQHDFLVTKVTHDFWPSGDPRVKVVGTLVDVAGQNKPKADITWSPPPSPEEVAREKANWDQGKKRAISQAITLQRKCLEYYGKGVDKISEGDILRVETVRAKATTPGQLGFLRVVALHSKDKIGAAGQAQKLIPF